MKTIFPRPVDEDQEFPVEGCALGIIAQVPQKNPELKHVDRCLVDLTTFPEGRILHVEFILGKPTITFGCDDCIYHHSRRKE